ncbi:MAG: hypothetical protein ACODAG_07365 [Myxococcota bacterium]
MALTGDRDTPHRSQLLRQVPVAADAVIHKGAQVAINGDGLAVPFSEATGLTAIGRAESRADNTGGSDGDETVDVLSGTFRWNNSEGADEITREHIGDTVYAVDDETVALTDDSGARSEAGTVYDVDARGVWVTSTT